MDAFDLISDSVFFQLKKRKEKGKPFLLYFRRSGSWRKFQRNFFNLIINQALLQNTFSFQWMYVLPTNLPPPRADGTYLGITFSDILK